MIGALKRALPWWAKIGAKVALARLPLPGRTWQAVGLFAPGEMRDPDYALQVFDGHYRAAGSPAPGFAFLELGPGDSLASAVVGRAYGAARCWLVDAGAYASRDMAVYRRLIATLRAARPGADLDALARARDTAELLAAAGAAFLEDGLASLRTVPDGACDFAFSQAVLEHVPRAEFDATLAELARVLRPGGVASHQIDFRDHLADGLNNLRFRTALWEAPWFARRSGFYTNRLRPSEMTAAFRRAGFAVEVRAARHWRRIPIARGALAPEFRGFDDADLLLRDAHVVLRRAESGSGARR